MKMTIDDLHAKQQMSLRDKIDTSTERIEQWYDHWKGQVYISFSGGKDSTVLRHLVNTVFTEVPFVFVDTGLEYPEIREFVKSCDNVTRVRPKLTFRQVIEKYGYPVISKEQSRFLFEYQTSHSDKLKDIRINGNKWGMGKISKKWKFLIDAPFKISHKCCEKLKKQPIHQYEKETQRHPYLGNNALESSMRTQAYLRFGCNAFDIARPVSTPLAFWNENDIWEYVHQYTIPYSQIYDMGYDRTGCMFCMFGVHLEKEPNRFQRMSVTHPQLHKYCIENLECGKVLDTIGVPYK